jgi:choline-sulfatase
MLNQMRLEYDEYVANVDSEFGRLWDFMETSGILDNSYVVFTSDHGQLFERGYHGHDTPMLYEPLIHIPLLISRPGQQEQKDVFAATSGVDLLPSLLEVIGQPAPPWCEGERLPGLGGKEGNSERSIFAVEAKRNAAHRPLRIGTVALLRGHHKLIHTFGYHGYEDGYELYNLAQDPEELEDLYPSKRSLAADLQAELEARLQEADRPWSH